MKRTGILAVIAFMAFTTSVLAQEAPYIGAFGGYTLPSGVFTDLHNFSYKPVNNAGIFAEFDRLDHLYMNAGFMYSQDETGPITLSPEEAHPKDFSSNMVFDYLEMYGRLKWSYKVINHLSVYYSGGIYGGYLLYGSYAQDGNIINATDDMHKGNGGILGGVGVTFAISKLKLTIGADANYSFFFTVKDLPYRGTIYAAGVRGMVSLSYPLDIE